VGLSSGALQARVAESVELVNSLSPRAQVDVVGILWPTTPPPAATEVDAAIRAGAAEAGALFTHTLDLRFSSTSDDSPDDEGHDAIAVRLASSFSDLGLWGP
jgi:hypothetical protein